MKYSESEREIARKGHDLITQGRALIKSADEKREERRKYNERLNKALEAAEQDKINRVACETSAKILRDDILKTQFAYPGISITEASCITPNSWSSGEILIRFNKSK